MEAPTLDTLGDLCRHEAWADAEMWQAVDEFPEVFAAEEGLLQAALHSHYHRAQVATRLRELGGTPPKTDYILWIGRGRPSPANPSSRGV